MNEEGLYTFEESIVQKFQKKHSNKEYDVITECFRYTEFVKTAEQFIKNTPLSKRLVMCYLDITNFKMVNEYESVHDGDFLLQEVAEFIKQIKPGICGRFYSDHFVKLMVLEPDETIKDIQKILSKGLRQLLEVQNQRYPACNLEFVSGLYQLKPTEKSIIQVIDKANSARKRGKSLESVVCRIFDQELENKLRDEKNIRKQIEVALENKEFDFYLQPKINITNGKVVGAEALARWIKEDGTVVEPSLFLPIMEQTGSIVKLDFIIYEKVFAYIETLVKHREFLAPISVNVSRAHLKDSKFSYKLQELAKKYHILPSLIEFELTESLFIYNLEAAKKLLIDLKKFGYKVSVDDFGSGFSSLNILKDLNFDVLKIDRCFVSDKDYNNAKNKIIMTSIIEMANKLHMNVVLEGVETQNQVAFMKQLGCHVAQGFLFDKPLTKEDFKKHVSHKERYSEILSIAVKKPINKEAKDIRYKDIEEMTTKETSNIVQALFSTMSAGMVGINIEDGSVLFANDRLFEICGYTREELLSKNLSQFNQVLKLKNVMDIKNLDIKDSVVIKGNFYNEYPIIKKDGSIAYIRTNGGYASNSEWGNFLLCSVLDITREYEVRKKIEHSQRVMNEIMEAIHGGVARLVINDKFRVDFANDGFYQVCGYSRLKSLLNPFYNRFKNIIYQEDIRKVEEVIPRIIRGEVTRIDHRIKKRDGSIAWVTGYISKVYKKNEEMILEIFYIETTNHLSHLEKQQQFYANVYDSVVCGIVQYEQIGNRFNCINANSEAINIFGYSDHLKEFWKIKTPDMLGFVHPDDKQEYLHKLRSLKKEGDVVAFEHRIFKMDGKLAWIQGSAKKIKNQDQKLIIQTTFFDSTYYRELQGHFEENYRQLAKIMKQTIFEYSVASDTLVFNTNGNEHLKLPKKVENYKQQIKNKTIAKCLTPLSKNELQVTNTDQMAIRDVKREITLDDGSICWISVSFFISTNDQGEVQSYIGTIEDITNEVTKNKHLEYLAQKDHLTGLYNKRTFKKKCKEYLLDSKNQETKVLLFMDLDDFKKVNDTYGHPLGDKLLAAVGKGLQGIFRKNDIVGRIGGDEFVVLMKDVDSKVEVEKKAKEIQAVIQECYHQLGLHFGSCSIGASIESSIQSDYEAIIASSDSAMYLAKQHGKNSYYIINNIQ